MIPKDGKAVVLLKCHLVTERAFISLTIMVKILEKFKRNKEEAKQ